MKRNYSCCGWLMNNLPYHFLVIWLFAISKRAFPFPITLQEKQKEQEKISAQQIFIPENNAVEDKSGDPPVFIMVPVLGERPRRNSNKNGGKLLSLDDIPYEVPTMIQLNGGLTGENEDVEESRKPGGGEDVGVRGDGGPSNDCCPPPAPRLNLSHGGEPICLTISIDNLFPPGKAGRYVIANSSQMTGTGAVLKITFIDTKTSICTTEITLNFDSNTSRERIGTQKKKKVEEEDDLDEEEGTTQPIDERALQDIIFKLLSANKSHNINTMAPEESVFIESSSVDPSYTLVLNPSSSHKTLAKHVPVTQTKRSGSTLCKDVNPPDFDSLLRTVQHLTSTMPKEKLIFLLSSLINKAASNKDTSSDQ